MVMEVPETPNYSPSKKLHEAINAARGRVVRQDAEPE
jgi:hypothetical protein